ADKSMDEQSKILDTVKSKLIQANTATTSTAGRNSIGKDISKLLEQLDNIAKQVNYNGIQLLQADATLGSSSSSESHSFQIGEKASDMINLGAIRANTSGLSLGSIKDLKTAGSLTRSLASSSQTVVDNAITTLNTYRGEVGSTQNQ
ncbi:flagellin N-terminal helical domain-containing protein, partial [Aliarcobacter skirrowii]